MELPRVAENSSGLFCMRPRQIRAAGEFVEPVSACFFAYSFFAARQIISSSAIRNH
jgi:hypothetical protein